MDFKIYPVAYMTGRVTNIPELRHSYKGTIYTKIFLYLYDDRTAMLMPIIAFNKIAKKFVRFTQQGDLLKIAFRIDPVPNRGYLNPTLIASDFCFLEPLKMREMYHGDTGKQLNMLFPMVPQNYSESKHSFQTAYQFKSQSASASSSNAQVRSVSTEIETSSASKSSSTSADNDENTADWIRHANEIGKMKFPDK